jgi:hypothetical protein
MRAEPIRCRAPMRNRRPPQLVGGVADFVRKLIIGHSKVCRHPVGKNGFCAFAKKRAVESLVPCGHTRAERAATTQCDAPR